MPTPPDLASGLAFRGVIEGFYGRPWTPAQRLELLDWMSAWGLDTYVYGPKDDIRLRAAWRDPYDASELAALERLAAAARERGIAVHYAVAPGLDMRYAERADRVALHAKVDQLLDAGFGGVSLLFDDIPAELPAADRSAFASFAHAQVDVANELREHLEARGGAPLIFCPTEYCDRFAAPSLEESPYLRTLGAELHGDIDVYWTGPEIVSETIAATDAERVARVLQRPPVIWDNLHANDYDSRRLCLGPYAGRPQALKGAVRGVISNPNTEFEANFVPLRTLAAWLRGDADPAAALDEAIAAWAPRFAGPAPGSGVDAEGVRLLVDYLYLPFEHGPRAREHLADARAALGPDGDGTARARLREHDARLRRAFRGLTEVARRDLAYALYPYAWDLKHESDALARRARRPDEPFCRPDALANTYRSGVVDAFQALLPLGDDGCVRR